MANRFRISVIIPTYNPALENLNKTLNALRYQDLPVAEWECIIVDNASDNHVLDLIDLSWQPNSKIIRENKPGLTFARISGYQQSQADLLVFADDDNVLDLNYLSSSLKIFDNYSLLGVAGGKSEGAFEIQPAGWIVEFYSLIAVRPREHPATITTDLKAGYPAISPIGAGMVVRRTCFQRYAEYINSDKEVTQDRTGGNLSSGGDNEINIIALNSGYQVGFFPELSLLHLIPKQRLELSYLKRLNYSSSRSWVKLLHKHKLCPWQPISKLSIPLRRLKAFARYQPWKSPANAIRYYGACGTFRGLSELK